MAQMRTSWGAVQYGQEVAWHKCMGQERVLGLHRGDLTKELLGVWST